jgi:hypothetical protein
MSFLSKLSTPCSKQIEQAVEEVKKKEKSDCQKLLNTASSQSTETNNTWFKRFQDVKKENEQLQAEIKSLGEKNGYNQREYSGYFNDSKTVEIDTTSTNLPHILPKDTDKLVEMNHNMLITFNFKNPQIKDEDAGVLALYYFFSTRLEEYIQVNLLQIYGPGPGLYQFGKPGDLTRLIIPDKEDMKPFNMYGSILKLYGYKKDIISQEAGNTHRKNKTKQNKTKQNKTKQNKTKKQNVPEERNQNPKNKRNYFFLA